MPRRPSRLLYLSLGVAIVTAVTGLSLAQPKNPPGETVRGILTAKGDTWLEIRPEGEKTPQRYALLPAGFKLDAKSEAWLKGLAVGSELQITVGPNRRIASLAVLGAPGASGLVTGTVLGVSTSGTWYLEVRDDQGRTERYWPAYRGGPGYGPLGGFDKEMSHAFTERNVGDRVEIRRSADDHIRVQTMRLLALADRPAKLPGGEAGTVTGPVVSKGKDEQGVPWIVIAGEDGAKEHYLPQRIAGAPEEVDRDVVRAIGTLALGQRVEARWFREGERRLYALKPIVPAKP